MTHNLKVGNRNLLLTLLVSGAIVLTGCGHKKYTQDDLNFEESSIESEINDIADKTNLDDNMDALFNKDSESGYYEDASLRELLDNYKQYYDTRYFDNCNSVMENVGMILLEQQVADSLGIGIDDISHFVMHKEYETCDNVTEVHYKVLVTYNRDGKTAFKDIKLSSEQAERMGINIHRASYGGFINKEKLDELYNAYQEFIMTSGTVNDEDELILDFDSEKIESFCIKH